MNEIIARYLFILSQQFSDKEIIVAEPMYGNETNDIHLIWMLRQIRYNEEQSLTKKHRWLGFVQGVMTCKGYLTVLEERDLTRPILDGS